VSKRVRVVSAREIKGRKVIGEKVYEYVYYTLPLNLYVRKNVIEKWGKEFVVESDPDNGIVVIKPKKLAEQEGLKIEEAA
jgi:hypothetical protein